jgi:hypothetical protein
MLGSRDWFKNFACNRCWQPVVCAQHGGRWRSFSAGTSTTLWNDTTTCIKQSPMTMLSHSSASAARLQPSILVSVVLWANGGIQYTYQCYVSVNTNVCVFVFSTSSDYGVGLCYFRAWNVFLVHATKCCSGSGVGLSPAFLYIGRRRKRAVSFTPYTRRKNLL